MAIKAIFTAKTFTKIIPQQIQLMKMLQLPTVELEKRIKEELEINPALEEGEEQIQDADHEEVANEKRDDFDFQDYVNDDSPYYKNQSNNFSKDQEEYQKPLSFGYSLSERLTKQIRLKIKNEK